MNETSLPDSPLPLPKFTFLCGHPGNGQMELAKALCDLDPSLGPMDFQEPLRMATAQLFLGGFHGENLLDDAFLQSEIPITKKIDTLTYERWLLRFNHFLRNTLEEDVLGQLAVREYQKEGPIFDRLIYRDCPANCVDVAPFVKSFGLHSCLCIHCGPLDNLRIAEPSPHNVWLPEPSLDSRIRRIRRELEPVR